jgi:methylenetetrahydrofolate reductase (NADPH)
METSLLVNVVHNDFKDPEAIFKPFLKAAEDYTTSQQITS